MIRKSLSYCAAALMTLTVSQLVSAQSAATAVLPAAATLAARYAAAVGAPAFIEAQSIVTKGGMAMPAAGINATFEMLQLGPNSMKMVTTIPGMGEVHAGFDGTTAWSADPMQGARVLTGKEFDQVRDEADRRAMVRSPEAFASLQTLSDTTIAGERCYLVKLTWKSGRETFDCFSPTSGLLVASRSTQKTAMGDIPVLALYSDYKKFGNVTLATKTTMEMMGQQQVLTITSVDFGTGAGLVVAPPPAVQALIKK